MYTPQALSACQDSPLLTADTQTGSSGYTLHFPPPAQRLCSVCWRGLPPSLYCWSVLLGHDEVSVEVLVQGLREAPARTGSFPAFPNPQRCLGHEPPLFPTLHGKRCANGWVWPKQSQTSAQLVFQREQEGGKTEARRGKSPRCSFSQLAIVPRGQRRCKVIKFVKYWLWMS